MTIVPKERNDEMNQEVSNSYMQLKSYSNLKSEPTSLSTPSQNSLSHDTFSNAPYSNLNLKSSFSRNYENTITFMY